MSGLVDPDGFVTLDDAIDERQFSALWHLAAATYGVGDIVTTVALLYFSSSVGEANALLVAAVDAFGRAGLVGTKLAAFGVVLAISAAGGATGDRFLCYLPPAVVTIVGTFTTAFNLRLLAG